MSDPAKIKRFSPDYTGKAMFPHSVGKWMRFVDHAAEVARLQAVIGELEARQAPLLAVLPIKDAK